jgi:hypothetical protein
MILMGLCKSILELGKMILIQPRNLFGRFVLGHPSTAGTLGGGWFGGHEPQRIVDDGCERALFGPTIARRLLKEV